MDSKPSIVFRADGSSQMGLGHFFRSSALAAMLTGDFKRILVTRCTIATLLHEAQSVFDTVVSVDETEDDLAVLGAQFGKEALVVLDGYQFDTAYQERLAEAGFTFFAIDDIHAFPFLANVVINHAGGLHALDYRALPFTQFYLGPTYALLRNAFLAAAKNRRNKITDNNCFICYGGADPNNRTLTLVKSLCQKKLFDTLHVVVGSAYQFREELEEFLSGKKEATLHIALTPDEMVAVMQQCSYAVCSPSTIVYEYLSVGGIVFLDQIADNQKDVISYFIKEGMAFPLNTIGALSDEQIKPAFQKQAIIFDGKSSERFRKLFRQFFCAKDLSIRKAEPGDLAVCFEWANDPEVRAQSYNQNPIKLAEHSRWFMDKLQDTNSYYYVFVLNKKPVAQIRFQLSGGEAVLGYLVSENIRQKGLGTAILSKGIEQFLQDAGKPVTIAGHVKKENIASQRSFEKLAFSKQESTVYPDSFTYTMSVHGD